MSGVLRWLHDALAWGLRNADNADDLEEAHDAVRDALAPLAAQLMEQAEAANEAAAMLHTISRACPSATVTIDGHAFTVRYPGAAGTTVTMHYDFERLALALAQLAEQLGHLPDRGAPAVTEVLQ